MALSVVDEVVAGSPSSSSDKSAVEVETGLVVAEGVLVATGLSIVGDSAYLPENKKNPAKTSNRTTRMTGTIYPFCVFISLIVHPNAIRSKIDFGRTGSNIS